MFNCKQKIKLPYSFIQTLKVNTSNNQTQMTKTNPNDSQNKHSKVSTFQVCTLLPLLRFCILHWVSVQRLLSYRGEWHGRYFLVANASLSVRERDISIPNPRRFFFFSLLKKLETQDLSISKDVHTQSCFGMCFCFFFCCFECFKLIKPFHLE